MKHSRTLLGLLLVVWGAILLAGFGLRPAHASTQPLPANWAPLPLADTLSFEITSQHTGQRYRILLGLPHGAAPAAGYPVLWALDGLASFPLMEAFRPRPATADDSPAWRARLGAEPAGLIVAIAHASGKPFDVNARALDYTPPVTGDSGDQFSPRHGGADAFLRFLSEELRPLLAQHFPLDAQRHTLFGFSYGGLFALHVLSTQPQHFQRYWAASPSLWFDGHQTLKNLPAQLAALRLPRPSVRVMITVGADEQFPSAATTPARLAQLQQRAMVDNAVAFTRRLQAANWPDLQLAQHTLPAHDHHDMLLHGARRVIEFAFQP